MTFPYTCSRELIHLCNDVFTNENTKYCKDILIRLRNEKNISMQKISKSLFSEILNILKESNINVTDSIQHEGFWCDDEDKKMLFKEFPFPQPGTSEPEGLMHFANKLKQLEDKLKPREYLGTSRCRICGKPNGSGTYVTTHYAWPTGYSEFVSLI